MTCWRKVVPVLGSPMCRKTFGRAGSGSPDSVTARAVNRTTSRIVDEGALQPRLAGRGGLAADSNTRSPKYKLS
jgi:hypothetical protein